MVKRDPKLANAMSVTRAVREEIDSDLSVQDALVRDYVNLSALARALVPKVASRLGKKAKGVSEVGVATALKRVRGVYARELPGVSQVIAGSVVNVRTQVSRLSVERTRRTLQIITALLSENREDFIQVSESPSYITMIFDQRLHSRVKRSLASAEVLDEGEGEAAITIHSPKEIVTTPGCISLFYNQLFRRGINVEDTVSCFTDTIMLVEMKDASRAFEALTELVGEEQRKLT